jgi:hypothetical protein
MACADPMNPTNRSTALEAQTRQSLAAMAVNVTTAARQM